jgi:hypothetical protein
VARAGIADVRAFEASPLLEEKKAALEGLARLLLDIVK